MEELDSIQLAIDFVEERLRANGYTNVALVSELNRTLGYLMRLQSAQCNRPEEYKPKGEWLRMSDLSEKDDNRYKCSCCGNVIRHKSSIQLYTFNGWCGRCGSDNRIR